MERFEKYLQAVAEVLYVVLGMQSHNNMIMSQQLPYVWLSISSVCLSFSLHTRSLFVSLCLSFLLSVHLSLSLSPSLPPSLPLSVSLSVCLLPISQFDYDHFSELVAGVKWLAGKSEVRRRKQKTDSENALELSELDTEQSMDDSDISFMDFSGSFANESKNNEFQADEKLKVCVCVYVCVCVFVCV